MNWKKIHRTVRKWMRKNRLVLQVSGVMLVVFTSAPATKPRSTHSHAGITARSESHSHS